MTIQSKNPETLVLHAGPRADAASGAVAVPIVQSTAFQFRDTEHAANLFALKEFGNCLLYTSPSPRDGLLSRMPSSA